LPALFALAGCDKVLSLNDIQIMPGALTVNGSYGVRRVLNSATRLPFTSDDLPAGRAPQGTFVQLADGNKAQLVWNADDHFYFNRTAGTQAYRIVFQGTDPVPTIEYQLAVDNITLLNRLWGRSKRMPVSAGTALHYSLTIPSALTNPFEYVASSGIWTETGIGPSQTLDWPTAGIAAAAGPIALLDATPLVNNDRAYYLIYDQQGTGPAMYTRLVYYRFDDVTMTDATVTSLPATPPPFLVNADTCILVNAPRADEITRITKAGYVDTGPAAASWVLNALPVMAMGTDVTMLVAYASGTDNYGPTPVTFGTPFGGYDLALQLVAVAPHSLMAPGASAPITVSYGSVNYIQPLTTTSCTQPADFKLLPELPTAPLLDGAPLEDGQLQLDRSRLAKLTWTTVPGGTTTELFRADLYEVAAGTNQATTLALRATWYTTNHTVDGNPQILVDPSLLKFGKSYAIQVSDEIGYPDAASGDLTTIAYPNAIGFAWTGVLQVAN
jgi:hypothetical protein